MSLPTSLPYVGSPIENLTLSDPKCNSDACKAFYEGHQLSQKLVSYNHQYDYGHYVTWFYITCIGLATLVYVGRRFNEIRSNSNRAKINFVPESLKHRSQALWKLIAYRRWPGRLSDRIGLPSFGILIFMTLVLLYLLLLTFWAKPYYRLYRGYGSPPVGVRTGLMAVAMTPLIIALSGKANLITMLTGIGHEKLNIFHRWVGWFTFGLSVAHTIPFIVAPLQQPFGGPHALHAQYYKKGPSLEYTGTPPLGILFGLLLLSLPFIRHRIYEIFYHVHFWLAVTYLGLMFWHAKDEGDSWVYLWATITVWLFSILVRVFYYNRPTSILSGQWGFGCPVTLQVFPDNMIRLEVLAPQNFHWKAGQHVYLRIPKLNLLDNHPFTIATSDLLTADNTARQRVYFYVRSYAGFTRRLQISIDALPDEPLYVWLDGPYGSYHKNLSLEYDNIILVAGGGGISAIMPRLEDIAKAMKSQKSVRVSSVQVHWSIRKPEALRWIAEQLEELDLAPLASQISINVYITGKVTGSGQEKNTHDIEAASSTKHPAEVKDKMIPASVQMQLGRMNIRGFFDEIKPGGKIAVIGCGPESLKVDISNVCAATQIKVFRGQVQEISLQTETFGW